MTDPPLVTERMQALIDAWEPAGDRRCDFLRCYALMTRNMLAAVDAGEFHDPAWVSWLLQHFANYYFNSLDDYEAQSVGTAAVWRYTHDAARQPGVLVLQNLLLGINAHINYDLVLALVDVLDAEWPALPPAQRQARYEDHCHVNEVISRTVDAVQDQVVERVSPEMRLVDAAFGPLDEWVASRLIAHWREEVWQQAVAMLDVQDWAEREALRQQIETVSLERARGFLVSRPSTLLR